MSWWDQGSRAPRLVCLPSLDVEFAASAQEIIDTHESIDSPIDLENALRPMYPSVRVRARGLDGEPLRTWYVYRDGRYPSPFENHAGRVEK